MKPFLFLTTALVLLATSARAGTIEMKVFGMVCGFCAQGIEASLRKNPAVKDVVVSLERKLVVVETHEARDIADVDLKKAIADAGYDLKGVARSQRAMADYKADLAAAAP